MLYELERQRSRNRAGIAAGRRNRRRPGGKRGYGYPTARPTKNGRRKAARCYRTKNSHQGGGNRWILISRAAIGFRRFGFRRRAHGIPLLVNFSGALFGKSRQKVTQFAGALVENWIWGGENRYRLCV